jgi:uncharacterized protein YcbX
MTPTPVTLSAIHIYPVKSLGGIALKSSVCTARGLRYDRRFLVVDRDGKFLTQRTTPKMATVWVDVEDGGEGMLTLAAPDLDSVIFPLQPAPAPAFKVAVWSSIVDAHEVSADASRFLSDYLGIACRLVYMPDSAERKVDPAFATEGEIVSFADGYPFLLTSEASLADLNSRLKQPLPMNRFRPNLVVKGCAPYAEDVWKEIRIGTATFRIAKPCARCQVTTTDQATGEVLGPEPLQTLARYRNGPDGVMFGQNLLPLKLGDIVVGDTVEVLA